MIDKLTPHAHLALCVAGLVFLVVAAWAIAAPLGLAAAGVACLLLEWRTS